MLCDMVIASSSATFAIPEGCIGIFPPIATVIGASVIGRTNLNMMMLTGEAISAEEAHRIGLVNWVVPDHELLISAKKLATNTLRVAPSSVKVIKEKTNQRLIRKLERSFEELASTAQTQDSREGHNAFLEKRLPKWASHNDARAVCMPNRMTP